MVNMDIYTAGEIAVRYNILPDAGIAASSIRGCKLEVIPVWEVERCVDSFLEVFYNFNPETIGGKIPDENFFFKE
jgi:NitT/TauT family transport system substrate-binding protein